MSKKKIKFGYIVRDIITGYEGYVTAKTSYITGCTQYYLVPKKGTSVSDNNQPKPDGFWVDEPRLEIIEKIKFNLKFKKGISKVKEYRRYGGPTPDTPLRNDRRSV